MCSEIIIENIIGIIVLHIKYFNKLKSYFLNNYKENCFCCDATIVLHEKKENVYLF